MKLSKLLPATTLLSLTCGAAFPTLEARGGCDGGNGEVSARGGCYGNVADGGVTARDELKTGGGEIHCLGPVAEVALRPACHILRYPETEHKSSIHPLKPTSEDAAAGDCQPGYFTCAGGSNTIITCNGSGDWVAIAQCSWDSICYINHGVPYCGAGRDLSSESNADIQTRGADACLGPVSKLVNKPECQIEDSSKVEHSTDLVERDSCTPGTYRCNGLSPNWVVCDGSGEWQIAGTCGTAFCEMWSGNPYCIAHRSIERQVLTAAAAESHVEACIGPVADLAHKKECQVSKEVASKVELSTDSTDRSLCTPGQYVCNGGSSLYWLICDVSGQWQTGGYCGGGHCNTINGVPFCFAKRELTTNIDLQERGGCDGGNGKVSARGGCYGEVPDTVDIVSRDDGDCLGPLSEVAKKKKCQVEASSRVKIASDSVNRASCNPGEYTCANGWNGFWLVCGVDSIWVIGGLCMGGTCEFINGSPYCTYNPPPGQMSNSVSGPVQM